MLFNTQRRLTNHILGMFYSVKSLEVVVSVQRADRSMSCDIGGRSHRVHEGWERESSAKAEHILSALRYIRRSALDISFVNISEFLLKYFLVFVLSFVGLKRSD